MYVACAGGFHYLAQHGEEPRRHARQVGDVFFDACLHQCRQFLRPVLHQRHLLAGHAQQVHHRVDVFDEVGREVADACAGCGAAHLVGKTAAQDECLACKQPARRVHIKVKSHHVAGALVVVAFERFARDGYVFAFAVAGARRLGKVSHTAMPQHIFLASHHAHDVRLEVLVAGKRNGILKLIIALNVGKAIFLPVFGVAGVFEQIGELLALHCLGVADVTRNFFEAALEYGSGYWGEINHCILKNGLQPSSLLYIIVASRGQGYSAAAAVMQPPRAVLLAKIQKTFEQNVTARATNKEKAAP